MFRHQIIHDMLIEASECNDNIDITVDYKGIPFMESSKVVKVSKYYSAFKVTDKLAAAIKITSNVTILYRKYDSKMMQAKFLEVDKNNSRIINLYHFKLIDKPFIPEFSLRVNPDHNFILSIIEDHIDDSTLEVADLLKETLAFFIIDKNNLMYDNKLIHLRFKFRISDVAPFEAFTVRARIFRVDIKQGRSRVAAKFTMSKEDFKKYMQYISLQEKAIRKSFDSMRLNG